MHISSIVAPCKRAIVVAAALSFGLVATAQADFINGNFEAGDFTGWTVQGHGIPGNILVMPPTTLANLGLTAGSSMSANLAAGSAGSTNGMLAWGTQVARAHDEVNGYNNTASSLTQSIILTNADIDSDGRVHVRFVAAPVLEDPGHPADQQPYFFIELTNKTKGTQLFHTFNYSNEAGVPWQTYGGYKYTDWQAFDIPMNVGSDVDIGDEIELVAVGAGCGQSGHAGAVYLDDVRTTLSIAGASLWVTATGPATACRSLTASTSVTYTYTYENNGDERVNGIVVNVPMPVTSNAEDTLFSSITNPSFGGGTCSAPANPGDPALCNIGDLNPGESGTFSLTVQIPSGPLVGIDPTLNNGSYTINGTSDVTGNPISRLGPLVRTVLSVCAVAPTKVPSLNQFTMLLLAGLLSLLGVLSIQRRA
ncbi:MAG TPA: hypothetical protein VFN29_05725 [Chiayiivirga sp.]|nr:hypothetical protein [Chiayiivirga sp.]